jgi:hypothetical protein
MIVELTEEEKEKIADKNFKGIFVCCDSPICNYCARKHYPDDEFEDAEKCAECIHSRRDAYTKVGCGLFEDHFLGIECVTWEDEL